MLVHRLWKIGLSIALLLAAWPVLAHGLRASGGVVRAAGASLPDGSADRLLGQAAFNTNAGGTSASALWLPAGVAIAPVGAPNAGRLFVVEYGYIDNNVEFGNHRVLSWPSAAAFTSGQAADLVIGQADFTSRGGALAQNRFYGPEAAAVDGDGNLWVADTENNRVLRFDLPFSNGMDASLVLGQPDFFSNEINQGGNVITNTLYFPRGLAVDTTGNLYVADDDNHRVLRFSPPFTNNMDASLVIGQADFTSGSPNRGTAAGKNTLNSPKGIAMDAAGNLYVAEYDNNRVTRFAPPFSNGMDASGVYGQPDYTSDQANNGGMGPGSLSHPVDIAVSADGGELFVTDQWNVRLLGYADPLDDAIADQVYGQPNFTSATPNNGGISALTINEMPLGLAVDANGSLYHADFSNNRLLAYNTSRQVVGDGTPGSCTEGALEAALASGGNLTFQCGSAQIDLSSAKVIASAVTIDGGNAITLSGGHANRLFVINAGAALTLRNIVLAQGYSDSDGGAIYNAGTLTIENSTLRDSQSALSGGAIVNYGVLTITDSLLEGNQALNGGALYPRWAGSQTTITHSVLRDNHATDTTNGWGGAILVWDGARVTISDSDITANTAQYGGGIYNLANSTLELQPHTRLSDNQATMDGGGLLNAGSVSLASTEVSGNAAGTAGGGIANYGSASFNQASLSSNSADLCGGGFYNYGTAEADNTILNGNTAGMSGGGGVCNFGMLGMTNLTLSGNSTSNTGGGLHNFGTAWLTNVTLSDNSALTGGNLYNEGGTVTLKNSVVAHNLQGGNCGGAALTADNSDRYSLSSDNTCSLAGMGSLNGVDPLLTPLGNFGGGTLVHMLKLGSPAIDAVAGSDAPIYDQRLGLRPQGSGYDMGAVERQPFDTDLPPRLYLPVLVR